MQQQINPSVMAVATQIRNSDCPKCKGPGPIDIHVSHVCYSFIFLTQRKSTPALCCKKCGTQSQTTALIITALVGWWGIPWGLIYTPMQIAQNISGMSASDTEPSEALLRYAQKGMVAKR
jgi:hypothetical protein